MQGQTDGGVWRPEWTVTAPTLLLRRGSSLGAAYGGQNGPPQDTSRISEWALQGGACSSPHTTTDPLIYIYMPCVHVHTRNTATDPLIARRGHMGDLAVWRSRPARAGTSLRLHPSRMSSARVPRS